MLQEQVSRHLQEGGGESNKREMRHLRYEFTFIPVSFIGQVSVCISVDKHVEFTSKWNKRLTCDLSTHHSNSTRRCVNYHANSTLPHHFPGSGPPYNVSLIPYPWASAVAAIRDASSRRLGPRIFRTTATATNCYTDSSSGQTDRQTDRQTEQPDSGAGQR